MKIKVDYDLCQGHGACMGEAPQLFLVDEKGMLTVLHEQPPEILRPQLEAAVKFCPTGALRIEE